MSMRAIIGQSPASRGVFCGFARRLAFDVDPDLGPQERSSLVVVITVEGLRN